MNSNQNKPLTAEEISKLHGKELSDALSEGLESFKKDMEEIDESISGIVSEIEGMSDIDIKSKDDDSEINELENNLNIDLNNAVLDLATEDEILKDIEEGEE